MVSEPKVIYSGRAELAEGPVWHAGALWWVDIVAGTLNRLDPLTGVNQSRGTGSYLGVAAPCTDGRWLLARQHDCSLLDWETGRFTPLVSPEGIGARHRFNDGKCDAAGRFWVGTLSLEGKENEASLFVIHPSGEVRRMLTSLSVSNGLAWSPDGRTFYHADTPSRQVRRYTFDPETAELTHAGVLITFQENDGWPDGLTCDSVGHLWIGLWGGGAVVRVNSQSGEVMARHALPVSNVSSCTFGGPDLRTLYITTAWQGFSDEQRRGEPLAGSIFALRTDVVGQAAHAFPASGAPRLARG